MLFFAYLFCVITEGYLFGMFVKRSSLANKAFPFFVMCGKILGNFREKYRLWIGWDLL
jgi:hypothetical protein